MKKISFFFSDDIKIRFFEEKDSRVEWEAYGTFHSSDIHKQVAIAFKTPQYKDLEVTIEFLIIILNKYLFKFYH